jgi:hypothetical protein
MTGPRPPLKTDWVRGEFVNHRVVNDWSTRINELEYEVGSGTGGGGGGGGGIARVVQTVTTAMVMPSASGTDYDIFLSTGAVPVLPNCVGNTNRYLFINTAGTNVTLAAAGTQTISGIASTVLLPNASLELISNGVSDWKEI